jgi:uncharacterized protein
MSYPDADMGQSKPVSGSERIESLDIVRGVAVLGILLMNVWSAASPRQVWDYPLAIADLPGAPLQTWFLVQVLFEGSQRTLFSMLFGAGALMIIERLSRGEFANRAKGIFYRRTGWLIVFGLVNAYIFLWPADILYVYGLCGLVLYPLSKLGNRALVLIIALALLIPAGMRLLNIADLREAHQSYLTAEGNEPAMKPWKDALEKARPSRDDAEFQESVRIMSEGSFAEIFKKQAISSLILQTVVTLKWFFLDALAAMLLGMVFFRLGILTLKAPRRYLAIMLIAGYGIGLPLSFWETSTMIASDFDPIQETQAMLTYDIGRIAMATGHLSLILFFCLAGWGKWVKLRLMAVGRMALTNYLAQSILSAFIFMSFGLGLYGQLYGYYLFVVVAAIWLIEIIWSSIWLRHFRFGPVEWLWRSLSYGKRQPMRRGSVGKAGLLS